MLPIKKIKKDVGKLQSEIKARTLGYVVAAFGLIVGLAWNDAIKTFIEYWFPFGGNGIVAKFIYAGIITLVLGIVSYYVIGSEINDENEAKN